jgi:hypothetical protein
MEQKARRFEELTRATKLDSAFNVSRLQLAIQCPSYHWKRNGEGQWYQTDETPRPLLRVHVTSLARLREYLIKQNSHEGDCKIPCIAKIQWKEDTADKSYWWYDKQTDKMWRIKDEETLCGIYREEIAIEDAEASDTKSVEEDEMTDYREEEEHETLAPLPPSRMRCDLQPALPLVNVVPLEDQRFFRQVLTMIQHTRDGWEYDASPMIKYLDKHPDYPWQAKLKRWCWRDRFLVGEDVTAVTSAIEACYEQRSQVAMSSLLPAESETETKQLLRHRTARPSHFIPFIRKPLGRRHAFDIKEGGLEEEDASVGGKKAKQKAATKFTYKDIVKELTTGPATKKEARKWSRRIFGKKAGAVRRDRIGRELNSWKNWVPKLFPAAEAICALCGYMRWVDARVDLEDFKCGDECQLNLELTCANREDQERLHKSWDCFKESQDPAIPCCEHLVEVWVEQKVDYKRYFFTR